jgi:outer membrane receptor for ferrienterochelin and colicin
MLQKFKGAAILFIILLVSNLIAAQKDSIPTKQIKEVTVFSLGSGNISLPYISVDKQKLQQKDYNSTADALKNEAGIFLSKDGMWATSVNIRGLSEQRLLFLVDDDRIQTATDVAGVLSTVNLNSLEKIEVIKGAASVLYGNGAMGGVVNFVTYRPQYTNKLKSNGKLNTGYQDVNNMYSNSLNVNITNSNWYLSMNGSYRTAGNTKTPTGILGNSQLNNASWGLAGGMKYSENQELLVSYNHYEAWNTGIPGGSAFPLASTVKYKNFTRNQLSGEYIFTDLTEWLDHVSLKAYTQTVVRDVENKVNSTTTLYPSSTNTTAGFKASADLNFEERNKLTVGAEIWQRKSETVRYKVVTASSDTTITVEQPTPRATMFDAGIFSHYKHSLIPTKLNLHAGLRLDFLQTVNDTSFTEIKKYKVDNGESIALPHSSNVLFYPAKVPELAYSAHIDIEYLPARNNKLLLSLASSYRAASIEERYKYINQAGGVVHKGNPDLNPEKGYFSNLSYSTGNKKVVFKADIFANYLFDLITEKKISSTLYQNTNISEAMFLGAETEFRWMISRKLNVMSNISYVRGRDVTANDFLPQIPPLHGFIALNYYLEKLFNTSLSAEWAAKQIEAASTETKTGGHIVLDWDIQTKPFKLSKDIALQVTGGIDNILDTAYYNHLTSMRTGGSKFLEPGRNVFAKAAVIW